MKASTREAVCIQHDNFRRYLHGSSLASRYKFKDTSFNNPSNSQRTIFRRNMSQAFLNHLLSATENRVVSGEDGNCMICLEDYNKLNTSTGIIESEVRLPCGHQVGSSCIVTWLQAHNSCPACRATFFPAQPRPYLEHGIMDGGMPRTEAVSLIREWCLAFGDFVPLYPVVFVARSIARHFIQSYQHQNRDQRSMVAVSIYMASHLVRQPKTPTEIFPVIGISPEEIRHVYRQAYPNRMQFIAAEDIEVLAGGNIEGMLAFLPRPDRENDIMDNDEDRRELQSQHVRPNLLYEDRDSFFLWIIDQIGPDYSGISIDISREILQESSLGLRSPRLVATISLYMAKHLLGFQPSFRRIASSVDIDEGTLETAYARIYRLRHQLIKPSILSHIALENLPKALEALPALNWPPL